jgi:hypothetical protein
MYFAISSVFFLGSAVSTMLVRRARFIPFCASAIAVGRGLFHQTKRFFAVDIASNQPTILPSRHELPLKTMAVASPEAKAH